MEHITIGQITNAITLLTILVGAFATIYKFAQSALFDKIKMLDKRMDAIEEKTKLQDEDIEDSKAERLILLNGTLACLKGLKEKGCNGPVTQGIENIEDYLMKKSHE